MATRFLVGLAVALALVLGLGTWAAAQQETRRPPRSDSDLESAYKRYLKEVRLIEIRKLRSANPTDFKAGRDQILAIDDPDAVAPLVHVLYGSNARYRGLLIEALGSHAARGSEAAQAYLQEVAVGDGSRTHRNRAVNTLAESTHPEARPPSDRLMAHLALDEVPVLRDRAATALATLDEKRAVWLLVERLVTEEVRLVGADANTYSMQFDIRAQTASVPQFRQRVIQAAVPGGIATAIIDLPEVQIIDVATTVAMMGRDASPRYERVKVNHPAVLMALKRLTGKDFGYDQIAWQRWLQANPDDIPAWEPIRITGSGPHVDFEE